MSMKKPNDLPLRRVTRSMVNKNATKQKSNLKDLLKLTKAQESLMSACSENDVPTVVALLEKHKPHLDPDRVRDSKLRTPLLIASAKGNTEIVKVLIQWGADVNNPMGDIVGNRPLHLAVASNNVDTVLALLEAGAQTKPDESRVINSDDGLPSLVRNQLRAPLELATSRLNLLMKQANTRNRTQSLSQVTKIIRLLKHYSTGKESDELDELTKRISNIQIQQEQNEDEEIEVMQSLRDVIEKIKIS